MVKAATLAIIAAFSVPSDTPDPLGPVEVCLTVGQDFRAPHYDGRITNPCTGGYFMMDRVRVIRD